MFYIATETHGQIVFVTKWGNLTKEFSKAKRFKTKFGCRCWLWVVRPYISPFLRLQIKFDN